MACFLCIVKWLNGWRTWVEYQAAAPPNSALSSLLAGWLTSKEAHKIRILRRGQQPTWGEFIALLCGNIFANFTDGQFTSYAVELLPFLCLFKIHTIIWWKSGAGLRKWNIRIFMFHEFQSYFVYENILFIEKLFEKFNYYQFNIYVHLTLFYMNKYI